eukprot:g28363.t1
MDVLALYSSIPHNDGIAATASILNTTNCQFPNTILQLIRFIFNHNVFTLDNRFIIRTHETAMGTRFAPQHVNIVMCRQTWDTLDRVPFLVQYFLAAEKLHHVLRSLQHIIDDDEHLAKIFPTFKQPPNLKQAIVQSKLLSLQDNIDHNSIQRCHGNCCKTCQIIDMDTTITRGNTSHHVHDRYSCDLAILSISDAA